MAFLCALTEPHTKIDSETYLAEPEFGLSLCVNGELLKGRHCLFFFSSFLFQNLTQWLTQLVLIKCLFVK